MSEHPDTEEDTAQSYRLDRLAGFSVIGAFVFSLALLFVGEPLFWLPFALGLGIGLPGFAILADRERDRERESGPATADDATGTDNDADESA
jgi:hypothetical protein